MEGDLKIMEYIIVFCTIDNFDRAKEISNNLLEKKLIACANIIPKITSIYQWENKIVEDNEILMIFKTKKSCFEKLKDEIKRLHSYDVPEIISVQLTSGEESYLRWIDKSLS